MEKSRMITATAIVDAAVDHNLVPSEYFAHFERFGLWQLDALKQIGLKPHHNLLDIGCGAMRLGLYAVPYLTEGHYCGVDAFSGYIELGHDLAQQAELAPRYQLELCDNFCFERFSRQFDFAIAQSVFTHLSITETRRCVAASKKVMRPGAMLLFTYLVGLPPTVGFLYAGVMPMRRSTTESQSFFGDLAAEFGLTFETPAISHPTQQVGLFRYP
jgi:SAM-dependent methyltransferase